MAKILGLAIAGLVERFDGQVLLDLPDDVPPSFLAEVVSVANSKRVADPALAWLLVDRRVDLEAFSPNCGFRELAQLREGNRLVVCFASDNRGMSTYTTVFAPLFGPEFPNIPRSEVAISGVANLEHLAAEIAKEIGSAIGPSIFEDDLFKASSSILNLLAESYQKEGNTRLSWVSRWWLHVAAWADEFVGAANLSAKERGAVSLLQLMFGAAGLPSPDSGPNYTQKLRKEYANVIRNRWASFESVQDELERLTRLLKNSDGLSRLGKIGWEDELVGAIDGAGSLIYAVTCAGANDVNRCLGWAAISESAFLAGKVLGSQLSIRCRGEELVEPWAGAPILRVLADEVTSASQAELALERITLVIPFLENAEPLEEVPEVGELNRDLTIEVTPGEVISQDAIAARVTQGGIEVDFSLVLKLSKWPAKPVRFAVRARGELAVCIGDEISVKVSILGPSCAMAVFRRAGSGGKEAKTQYAQAIPVPKESEPIQIRLDRGGLYEIALAFGEVAMRSSGGLRLEPRRAGTDFKSSNESLWLSQSSPRPLEDGDLIECESGQLFTFKLKTQGVRPLSPIIAACIGTRPSVDARNDLSSKCFEQLERLILNAMRGLEGDPSPKTLGHILLTTSESRHEIEYSDDGFYRSVAFRAGEDQRYPPPPSRALRELPQFSMLIEAYRNIGLSKWVEQAEAQEGSQGLLLSRVSLRDIRRDRIDELLKAYRELIGAADQLEARGDGFWARFPMSVVAYPESLSQANCDAVFLSPAHPLRLAWLWQLENAFAVVREETGSPPAFARLSEGWTIPWISGISPTFGPEPIPLVSVSCDTGPDYLFVGWSALVRTSSSDTRELRAPSQVNGLRFPAGASSGLTESAVEGAMRAFVRVFPQVRSLIVELPAFQAVQRSVAVDVAIGDAFRRLTSGEDGKSCLPGGIRVKDSRLRLGPVPPRDEFVHRDGSTDDRRKIEWERVESNSNGVGRVHIRLVESQASQIQAASVGMRRAGLPKIPLRRFPRRARLGNGIVIDPSFDASPNEDSFRAAIAACEGVVGKAPFALHVVPGPSFGDLSSSDWTVTGDAGLDPAMLQKLAVGRSSRHMLWEWRPAVAVGDDSQLEQRPFVTISRVPERFSSNLREKVLQLIPEDEHIRLSSRVDDVVKTLAQRGIGLNSLLAMGHHHATGALGFFFALRLLGQWISAKAEGELRLIVPVDAVDPFLRAVSSNFKLQLDTSKRADLLAVSIVESEGKSIIRFVPIEIKHYGLVSEENSSVFPMQGEARIEKHIKQLTDYMEFLRRIQSGREEASETHGHLINTAIGAVVDAAILLDPNLQGGDDPVVLRNLSSGAVELHVCPGVLMWFQKGGATAEAASASWQIAEGSKTPHARVLVDPCGCWREIWLESYAEASKAVGASLDWALCETVGASTTLPTNAPFESLSTSGAVSGDAKGGSSKQVTSEIVDSGAAGSPEESRVDSPSTSNSIVTTATSANLIPSQDSSISPPIPMAVAPVQELDKVVTASATATPRDKTKRGLPLEELIRRYRLVLATFEEFKILVHPPESQAERFTEGPASVVFGVKPGFGIPVSRIESQMGNLKLRLGLDDRAKIDFKVHRGLVLLDVPKADNERYFVDATEMWTRWSRPEAGFTTPVGEDRYGNIVSIDWSDSNSPHLLLAGQTGSGKSVALMSILAGAVHYYKPSELRLILVDPKQVELATFEGSPYLLDGRILTEAPDAAAVLERAVIEMEERYTLFAKARQGITNLDAFNGFVAENQKKPRWLIVLDEYADLTHDANAKLTIERSLTRLAQKARAAGIHVLVSTQKPIVDVISTVVRGNLTAALALRVRSAVESQVVLDEVGAEKLTGKGDALLKIGGSTTRLQCASFSRR